MSKLFLVREHTTPTYRATLKDKQGAVIPAADLTSVTLTYYIANNPSDKIRASQNVLNANNVTIDASGVLVWWLQQADTIVRDQTLDKEEHVALFEYTWAGALGSEKDKHEVRIQVRRIVNVTAL